MTAALTAAEPEAAATAWDLARLRRTYRPHGWTIWYGKATGQYWAAHTRTMVLVSGDDEADLATAINRRMTTARPAVPPRRCPGFPPRPQPRWP